MITLRYIFPIDNLPNLLQVVRSDIAVLQVVSVFPDIHAEQRDQTGAGFKRVLIESGSELDSLGDRVESLQENEV